MQQKLTPQQLMLMRLLQLPVTALEQRIKEELEKNPMLEVDAQPHPLKDENDQEDENNDENNDFRGLDLDDYFDDDDYSYRERLEKDRNVEQHNFELSEDEDFIESLIRQFNMQNISDRQRAIGLEIIGSIDGSGYLGRDLTLIANDMAFRFGFDADDNEMEQILSLIQSLDPPGVGARSLQECLSLQLHRKESRNQAVDDAIQIVDKHFEQLGNKHYELLMELLQIDESRLRNALDTIRRLNPKPGWGREEEHRGAHYILPDFIVTRDGDRLSLSLNDRSGDLLHISNQYSDIKNQLSTQKKLTAGERETLQFIKSKTDEAQWFIDTLKQRQLTLYQIMSAIVDFQYRYFVTGDKSDLNPMRLKDIAQKSGYDESTVSRVVNEKYVQTDFGTFLLRDLFSKAVLTEKGDILALENVKSVLQHIVDNEDKKHPMTDEALTLAMQEQGIKLSRRTVTKYRENLGIPVGRLRKELVKGNGQ